MENIILLPAEDCIVAHCTNKIKVVSCLLGENRLFQNKIIKLFKREVLQYIHFDIIHLGYTNLQHTYHIESLYLSKTAKSELTK